MTARKTTSTFLLFTLTLTSALVLSGCFLFSSDPPPPPTPAGKVLTVQQAEDAVHIAEKKLASANLAAEDAKDRAETAKSDADKFEERARKNGVDTSDPKSQTAQARGKQKDAEEDLKRAESAVEVGKRELDTARANLDAARNGSKPVTTATAPTATSSPAQAGNGDWVDFIAAWFLPVVGTLLGLSILGGLFWWTWATIKDGNDKLAQFINESSTRRESSQLISATTTNHKDTSTSLRDLSGKVSTLQDSVFKLSQVVQAMQREVATGARGPGAPPPYGANFAGQDNYESPAATEAVDFPIAASNFLARFGGKQQVVKADPLKGILVKDSEGRGAFALVRDMSVPGGQLYIIPRTTRFLAAEDFYNHYEHFYDCPRLTNGEVWVNVPAVVESMDGGWKLLEKGELEVRS